MTEIRKIRDKSKNCTLGAVINKLVIKYDSFLNHLPPTRVAQFISSTYSAVEVVGFKSCKNNDGVRIHISKEDLADVTSIFRYAFC